MLSGIISGAIRMNERIERALLIAAIVVIVAVTYVIAGRIIIRWGAN